MRMRRRELGGGLLVLVLVLITACQSSPQIALSPTVVPTPSALPTPSTLPTAPIAQVAPTTVTLSAEAEAYLTTALDIMEQHSINRRKIDWKALRTAAFETATGARVPADTYAAIQGALRQLGDRHSFLLGPQAAETTVGGGAKVTLPSGEIVQDRIAEIKVPGFEGSDAQATAYAEQAHAVIARLDATQPCGWIVDLRNNPGGNMWPMLAGIGPILGDGPAGSFVDLDGHHTDYSYDAGAARSGQQTVLMVKKPYKLHASMPTVAVVTSVKTASSGEAITIAFRGRPNTRSFGEPTFGVSTSNEGFPLADDAVIVLTTAILADRTGLEYGGEIVPDEEIYTNPVEAAATWLLVQPACLQK